MTAAITQASVPLRPLRQPNANKRRQHFGEPSECDGQRSHKLRQRTPYPHQQKAIEAAVATLAGQPRATAVMACGTGKTLVGQRVTEQILTTPAGQRFPNLRAV